MNLFVRKLLVTCLILGGAPLPPRSIGIIELGGKSRQVFEFKRLIGKVFRNKDLGLQRAPKMVMGSLGRAVFDTGSRLAHFLAALINDIVVQTGVGCL